MSVTWTTTEPTVDEWGQESTTGQYDYYVAQGKPGAGYWHSRIIFSIGRVTGSRDIAIKAVCQGIKEYGWTAQPARATPVVEVGGVEYAGAEAGTGTINTWHWNDAAAQLGTQYAVITGLGNGASIPCSNQRGGTGVTLTNPITAPAFHVRVSGSWVDANEVYANVNGTWTEVNAAYAKDGTWKELQ